MSAFGTPLDIVDYDMSKPAQTARIQVRLRPEVLALVKRAAAIQGQSVNAFVAGAAEEVAHYTIEKEKQVVRLSAEDQRLIAEALLNPPERTDALKRAFERYHSLIRESR
jgi:uncharacterized protein (DUF1778 family)